MKYTTAVVRKPGVNFPKGITTTQLGIPDYSVSLEQHDAYCKALTSCGLNLIVLDADERFPDGCFVEDTCIITEKLAVITNPGDERRRGEEVSIANALKEFKPLEYVQKPGTVDGGDILKVGNHFFIGRSGRTNAQGADQLAKILSRYGYSSFEVPVEESLHLKSSVTYVGDRHILCAENFQGYFNDYDTVIIDKEEEYACNCIWVNDKLIIPSDYPKTKTSLLEKGYELIELDVSEFRKMDGGLSCLSLLI